jgi:hypothetical protein
MGNLRGQADEQYDAIDSRFMRRVEALDVGKAPVLDLARRLALRAQEAQANDQAPR